MLLAELVATSARVAATRSRLAKLRELAQCLRVLGRDEIEIGVLLPAGETRQGKIGVGYALLKHAMAVTPATDAALTISHVDAVLDRLVETSGKGRPRAAGLCSMSCSRARQQMSRASWCDWQRASCARVRWQD